MPLPIFPLKSVLLPAGALELNVFEPRYQQMLEDCLIREEPFGVVFCGDHKDEVGTLRPIGCMAHIIETVRYNDGTSRLLVEGGARFRVDQLDDSRPYLQAREMVLEEVIDVDVAEPVLALASLQLGRYRELLEEVDSSILKPPLPTHLRPYDSFRLLDQLLLPEDKRQVALELTSTRARFDLACRYLKTEIARLEFLLAEPPRGFANH
jgi:hypothetical protein